MCVFQDICGIGEPQREIDPSTTIIAQRGISPLFTFRLSKQKTLGFQMLFVIQPLKKYLTEHESETVPPCHDKYLAGCQDAKRPLSKTASLPEGKCILLLYRILLSTVYTPMAIHWASFCTVSSLSTTIVYPVKVLYSTLFDCINCWP